MSATEDSCYTRNVAGNCFKIGHSGLSIRRHSNGDDGSMKAVLEDVSFNKWIISEDIIMAISKEDDNRVRINIW